MVWKNAETDFHGVEVFPKMASMVWKTGENGFHGVEDSVGGLSAAGAAKWAEKGRDKGREGW